jgi:hypothetical protein
MRALLCFAAWLILLYLCWPLALLGLVLAPFVWVAWLMLRLVFLVVEAFFALLRGLLFLPARVLGV